MHGAGKYRNPKFHAPGCSAVVFSKPAGKNRCNTPKMPPVVPFYRRCAADLFLGALRTARIGIIQKHIYAQHWQAYFTPLLLKKAQQRRRTNPARGCVADLLRNFCWPPRLLLVCALLSFSKALSNSGNQGAAKQNNAPGC